MKDPASSLWPIHYKPLPDELLSCWLVRLAHGHGLKVQTFCNVIFGNQRQVWNRDIDRLAPPWLLEKLSKGTGTQRDVALNTTLRAYEGLLYRQFRLSSTLPWILALKLYHRKREGHGLQFCPACLTEDQIPYFRKCWRVAFNTVCTQHGTMLLDRCPKCGVAVAVHRLDIEHRDALETMPVSYCHACGFDLRDAPSVVAISYDRQASELLLDASRALEATVRSNNNWDSGRYAVMHQLCRLMTTRYKHVRLREFVLDQVGFRDISLTKGHIAFQMRPIVERHHLAQLVAWLLFDIEPRLGAAWGGNTVRYNVLVKDFIDPPSWYSAIVMQFSNWRR